MIAALLAAVVQVGLDVVDAEAGRPLLGRHIGLIAHAASVTSDGRHAIEVLRAHGIDVKRVFAPEHGLRADAAAGAAVADAVDASSGLPVVSLYGTKRRPSREDLRDLDALVFDLQDAGVRFYSYESTLLLALDAAAGAGLELVVLDRPNPLGGESVQGPESERPFAFLSMAPGPLVHGLTVGELARVANSRRKTKARLTVVAMRGWTRDMTWSATKRRWIPPSPNLQTPEAALAYPGIALLEATNVSEGRGTASPFLLFGAPWLDPVRLRPVAAGFGFEANSFTPRASATAPDPKYQDVECRGFRVTTQQAQGSYAMGLRLLRALRGEAAFRWLDDGARLDALLGTPRVRLALEAGASVEAILAADGAAAAAFDAERHAALLY